MFKENNNHHLTNLFDTSIVMNEKVKKKLESSWAPIFYENVFKKIDEKPFEVLYSIIGRPNTPVNYILSLEFIKYMRENNDIEILNGFHFDYLIATALGIKSLGEVYIAERTLYYFRKRLYIYLLEHPQDEELLFGTFIKLLKDFAKEASIKLEFQRTDTTLFTSNIKKAGRLSLAYDVLKLAVKSIPENKLTQTLLDTKKDSFKTDLLYRTRTNETDTKLSLVLNLCKEAKNILEETDKKSSDAHRIVTRFLNEQSIPDLEGESLIPVESKDIKSDSLQSAYDEDATFRAKGNVKSSGYVLELSETCSPDNPFQLITDCKVAPNNTSDVELFSGRIETIKENTGCTDMYVDGGFHSEDVHEKAEENGITMHLTNMSGTKPSKKLPLTDFVIDLKTFKIISCPAGYTGYNSSVKNSQSTIKFPLEACMNCPLYVTCHSKIQKKDCVVRIDVKAIKNAVIRAQMEKDQKENTSMRAAIEGTNSSVKRTGLDRVKVCGTTKVSIASIYMSGAQNIKRFVKFKQGGYKPKKSQIQTQGIIAPSLG